MTRPTPFALLAAALITCVALQAPAAPAHAEGGENQKWEREWTATAPAGKSLGVERLKVVLSASGTRFASGEVVPRGKKAVRTTTHLQRDANGLHKYRRVRDERKGKGVFAFRKGAIIRVVPVNDNTKASELGSPQLLVWDAAALHVLEAWTKRLSAVTERTELPFLDVPGRTVGKAAATPSAEVTLYDAKAEEAKAVRVLVIEGLGPDPVRAYLTGARQLIGVETADRKLLLNHWRWEVPAAPEPEPAAAADGDAPPAEPAPAAGAAASQAIPDEEPGAGP